MMIVQTSMVCDIKHHNTNIMCHNSCQYQTQSHHCVNNNSSYSSNNSVNSNNLVSVT